MDGKSQFDIKSDQEEIIRANQRMKDENIKNLIRDLNEIEEDPLNPTELKNLMHRRGIPLRYIGKICTQAELNHTREISVTEVIARASKVLIKDGLVFLSEDEEAGFNQGNVKKCVQHYLHEIFNHSEDANSNQQSAV